MNKKYKILHLEDVPSDATLVSRELKKGGINFEYFVIETEEAYLLALEHFAPDIILCDHTLPSFNSFEAFKILKTKKLYIPFILISATVTEDLAMSLVSEGADDFIFNDRLKRLPNAFMNAIQKYRFEKERMQLMDDVREREALSKEFLRNNAIERETLLSELTVSVKDLKQFTYITSHNFRAPLSNLSGLLKLIDDSSLSENNRGIISMFKTATLQLNKTINDLAEILIIRNNVKC
ncbi:MAG: response regulator [Bacteroidota bacterium]